jgi:hypothetical protein
VDHSTSLWTDLGSLTDTFDNAPTNLHVELRRFGDDLAHAVASYLGLSITITGESGPVTLTMWRGTGGSAVGSSLRIPLPLICPSSPGSALILYAAAPGAFVDLGADLSFALGEPLAAFVLDAHLTPHVQRSANPEFTGLSDFSNVNRAIGVLLACGHTREQAHAALWDRAADEASRVLYTAAEAIINTAEHGVGPHPY